MRRLFAAVLGLVPLALVSPPAEALVTIDWVQIGSPGNACDTQSQGCFGAVAVPYKIGKYEVTNAQYTEFLNAVADADPNGLYDGMDGYAGGITRSGSAGSYSYATVAGRENKPVNRVSWYDSARFVNWLANGQPSGAQGPGTTETGTYTFATPYYVAALNPRNAGAQIFLPTEDEWYKAAYFDPGPSVYYDYPAGTDTQTVCATPTATPNRANCGYPPVVNDTTDVGAYTGSASPFGTFDQGGNVAEWNETDSEGIDYLPRFRGVRGGCWQCDPGAAAASGGGSTDPSGVTYLFGFRVAAVPEPATGLLLMAGLLGLAGWRRRRV